jgi:glycine/sarcosine N-methyltransferase
MSEPGTFYDSLAGDYHLMFDDWWASATGQGAVIARLLGDLGVAPGATVLDCTCGIGTQALPLAALGFRLTGTDLSASAIERARTEAARRGLDIRLRTADLRTLTVDEPFDAVISADNSLPHLRTDDDLARALASARGCLAPGGVFLASVRDYDTLVRDRVAGVLPKRHERDGEQWIHGQAWTWSPDYRTVTFDLFVITRQADGSWATTVRTTTYRALLRDELSAALTEAGFTDVRWSDTATSGYYQPIVTARVS